MIILLFTYLFQALKGFCPFWIYLFNMKVQKREKWKKRKSEEKLRKNKKIIKIFRGTPDFQFSTFSHFFHFSPYFYAILHTFVFQSLKGCPHPYWKVEKVEKVEILIKVGEEIKKNYKNISGYSDFPNFPLFQLFSMYKYFFIKIHIKLTSIHHVVLSLESSTAKSPFSYPRCSTPTTPVTNPCSCSL